MLPIFLHPIVHEKLSINQTDYRCSMLHVYVYFVDQDVHLSTAPKKKKKGVDKKLRIKHDWYVFRAVD